MGRRDILKTLLCYLGSDLSLFLHLNSRGGGEGSQNTVVVLGMYVLVHFLGHVLEPHAPIFYATDAPHSQWHFAA